MELFNTLKDQLNTNPANAIDSLLNLKSPHEEIATGIKDLLNPDNIKTIAKKVKSLNGNV